MPNPRPSLFVALVLVASAAGDPRAAAEEAPRREPAAIVVAARPPLASGSASATDPVDDEDVPPVRVAWPLDPSRDGGAVVTAPRPGRAEMLIPPPEPPPGPRGDDVDDDRLVPLIATRPGDPGARLAALRPGAGLPEPSLEPAPGEPAPRFPQEARPPGAQPPAVAAAGPATGPPVTARAPGAAEPPESASARARITKQPTGQDLGRLSETELGVLVPGLAAPSVGARVAVTEMTPPTEDVRRWQFESVEGLVWESEEARQEGNWIVLRGRVDVRSGIERIRADEMRLDVDTRKLIAEGNVVLDRLDARLTGRRLEYDVNTNTGLMFDAMGFTGDDLTFTSDVAEKIAENKYLLRGCTFTSCTQPSPIWQIRASKAIVDIDKFVYMWNPRVLFGKIPTYYLPWVAFPIKQDRATGFMIPRISTSSVRGTSVSEEFFWAISRSTDLTVGGTWWDKYGWRADATARWFLPGMSDYGYISGIFLRANEGQTDADLQRERYLVELEHRQMLGEWDLTVTGEIATDALVDEFEFGRNTTDTSLATFDRSPILNQRLTVQRRWGKHSLSLYAENDERGRTTTPPTPIPNTTDPTDDLRLEGTTNDVNRSLPRAEWRASGIQIASRKWATLDLQGSLAALHLAQEDQYDYPYLDPTLGSHVLLRVKTEPTSHDYYRADFYPQVSFPVGWGFLRVIPKVALRGTWWSRLEKDADPSTPLTLDQEIRTIELPAPAQGDEITVRYTAGEDVSTFLWAWDAGVRIEGPDFERIYKSGAVPGRKKWQHVIEPSVEWTYAPELDNVFLIQRDQGRSHYSQRFPSTGGPGGSLREGGLNEARLRLVNTVRSKEVVPPGSTQAQARDVVIWNLSTTWDLDKIESNDAFERPVHDDPFDCDGDGDTTGAGEGAGQRCPPRAETTRFANVQSDINLRLTEAIHFSLRNTYDVLSDDLTQSSLVGSVGGDWGYVDMSFSSSRDRRSMKANNTDLSVTGENWLYRGGRVRLGYDLTKELDGPPSSDARTDWLYRRFIVSYYNQCVGLSLSWEDNAFRTIDREKTWTFIVSLKDLGNYIRYRRRSTVQ